MQGVPSNCMCPTRNAFKTHVQPRWATMSPDALRTIWPTSHCDAGKLPTSQGLQNNRTHVCVYIHTLRISAKHQVSRICQPMQVHAHLDLRDHSVHWHRVDSFQAMNCDTLSQMTRSMRLHAMRCLCTGTQSQVPLFVLTVNETQFGKCFNQTLVHTGGMARLSFWPLSLQNCRCK